MMRLLILTLLAAAVSSSVSRADPPSPIACLGATQEAGKAEVIDARSIRLEDDRVLRFAGIEPFSLLLAERESTEAELQKSLAEMVAAAPIRFKLVSPGPDRYGRLSALVVAGDRLVQEMAARRGVAIAFALGLAPPCFDRILAAEDSARHAGRGLWKDWHLPKASPALAAHIGSFTIFEGRVLSVGNRPTRSYLNFGRRWTEDVTVEIAGADRVAFGGEEKLTALTGRRVRVRGFVQEKRGPMVAVASPTQLEVLDLPTLSTQGAEGGKPP